MTMGTGLLTDHYELTMLEAALASGAAGRRAVFEVFARRLPGGRRYGVVAGTARVLDALEDFRFDDADLDFLRQVVDERTLAFLADYRFSGDVYGYREGEAFFPGSPIMVVESTFAEAVLLETVILSILNHDCAIASAASRMAHAAGDRPLIEMGSRRTHEIAAVAAARSAYLCGFASTSNLMAGRRYGVPTAGTAAHAFVLLHDSEKDAFRAQLDSLGHGTTLLIDTYDVAEAVRTAVELAGPDLGAVRIDSGDLAVVAQEVRQALDALGAERTKIIVTGDLDEFAIAALAVAPVDGYGVGTALVTGSGHPTASLVYKLVAREDATGVMRPVAKRSVGKPSKGGRKWAYRRIGDGIATAEIVTDAPMETPRPDQAARSEPPELTGDRPLLAELVRGGEIVGREPLDAVRRRHRSTLTELPPIAHSLSPGDPAVPTIFK
ncbi:nicotinate phosphoribosyltransferase [Sphaerimonospora sp. CA-214678]|uniref:nicotinate phosphoribosyltransferase n=1 Tax=Sphaerimonospora sp. CA-214678 TaxID=3240029 RepID=UPI003D8DA0C0